MDIGDILAALFAPTGSGRSAGRAERILSAIVFVGLLLLIAFVWLAYSGF
jgi:hypothetical protein